MSARHLAGAAAPPVGDYDADIIILSLDRIEDTLAAIASARAQIGLTRHVLVLDQGSRPAGLWRLQDVVAGWQDVSLYVADGNLGVAGGRNLLSGLGRGRAIIGLDNDASFATPDTAARLVRALDAEPRVGAVGCRILTGDGEADDLSSWGYPASLLPRAGGSFDAVTFVGAGHAIRRTAWDGAGGYDARLFFCWEEYDFCLRAIALGWRIRYRGDIVVHHRVSPQRRMTWSGTRWFYFVRNRLHIERKLDRSWLSLGPRIGGYMLKGLRHGLLPQTFRAVGAAASMDPGRGRRRMSPAARLYLRGNDRAHRGGWPRRLITEVLSRPGGAPAADR